MNLRSIELLRLEMRLVAPVVTAGEGHDRRPVLLVRIETDTGAGVGECSALAEPRYSSEYADGAELVLVGHLLPLVSERASACHSPSDVMAVLEEIRGHAMAKAAIEMALLDAEGRSTGRSLQALLGGGAVAVPASATLGLYPTPEVTLSAARRAQEHGYRRIKVKIAPGADLAPLRAIREALPEIHLVADANGSYTPSGEEGANEKAIRAIDDLGLEALEQPYPASELRATISLARELVTPVILDESIASESEVGLVIELGASCAISLKPARLGGLLAAKRISQRCASAGVSTLVGGLFETGVGRAASLALASLAGIDRAGDLGASDRYFRPDLTAPHVLDEDGRLPVPGGPGLGVALDEVVVARCTLRRHRVC